MNEYMVRSNKVTSSPPFAARTYVIDGINRSFGIQTDVFLRVVDVSISQGWDKNGTTPTDIDEIVTGVMQFCSPKYKGDYSIYFIHSKFMDSFYAGVPSVLSLGGHSVVGTGIMEYDVSYKKPRLFGSSDKTALETIVIINDGWYNANSNGADEQYPYVPFEDIKSIIVPVPD